jgi:hypothetical protein
MCSPLKSSFLVFSDESILEKAEVLGVSFGASYAKRVASVTLLKDNEQHRTLTMLKK